MVAMTSAYSAYSVQDDSSSPLLTHFSILFLLLVHPDTLRATCISVWHRTTLASNLCPQSFPQRYQLTRTRSKLAQKVEREKREKSQAHLNTVKEPWIYSGDPTVFTNRLMLSAADNATHRADLQRLWFCPAHGKGAVAPDVFNQGQMSGCQCLIGTHRHPGCSSSSNSVLYPPSHGPRCASQGSYKPSE